MTSTSAGSASSRVSDKNAQAAAVDAVNNSGVSGEKGLRIGLTSVKTDTGEVIAMYGGADYLKNQLSNADQAVGFGRIDVQTVRTGCRIRRWHRPVFNLGRLLAPQHSRLALQNEATRRTGTISLLTAIEKSVNTVFVDMVSRWARRR